MVLSTASAVSALMAFRSAGPNVMLNTLPLLSKVRLTGVKTYASSVSLLSDWSVNRVVLRELVSTASENVSCSMSKVRSRANDTSSGGVVSGVNRSASRVTPLSEL